MDSWEDQSAHHDYDIELGNLKKRGGSVRYESDGSTNREQEKSQDEVQPQRYQLNGCFDARQNTSDDLVQPLLVQHDNSSNVGVSPQGRTRSTPALLESAANTGIVPSQDPIEHGASKMKNPRGLLPVTKHNSLCKMGRS